jgi:branched-chain amino acid transport system substrate-binding protein
MRSRLPILTRRACLALAGLSWWPARSAEPGIGPREILIGQTITLEGGRNAYGTAVADGVKLQVDEVNAAGGVNGRRIVLRVLDDDNKPATAEANARQLIADGAFVLFGCVEGGPSTAVAKVASEAGVPLFGPMAGSPGLRRPHLPMVFPVRAEHREEFRALLAHGKSIGMSRAAFWHADSDTGRQHLENVRLATQELGLELVAATPFRSDIDDAALAAMVDTFARARAQMVFNHGSSGLYTRLIRQAHERGLRATFMGVNSGSAQIAKALGPLGHGMVFAQVMPSPWEGKHEISREYQAAVQRARPGSDLSYGALEGFATAKALVRALQAAGAQPTRASFVQALYATRMDLGGLTARWQPGNHEGSRFVDLAMARGDGRFTQ